MSRMELHEALAAVEELAKLAKNKTEVKFSGRMATWRCKVCRASIETDMFHADDSELHEKIKSFLTTHAHPETTV